MIIRDPPMEKAVPASVSPNGIPTASAANSTVRRFLTASARILPTLIPARALARAISFGWVQNASSAAMMINSILLTPLTGVKLMV
jgi:hypothetical protein